MKKIDESTKNQKLDLKPDEKFKDGDWRYEKFLSRSSLDYSAKHILGSWYDEKAENLVAILYLARHLSEEEALVRFKKLGYKGKDNIEEAIATFTDLTNFAPSVVVFSTMNYLNEKTKKYEMFSKEKAIEKIKELGYTEADLIIGFTVLFGPEEFSYESLFEMYSYEDIYKIFQEHFGKEGGFCAMIRYFCEHGEGYRVEEVFLETLGWQKEELDKKLKGVSLSDFIRNVFGNSGYYSEQKTIFENLIELGYSDEAITEAFLRLGYKIDKDYLSSVKKEMEEWNKQLEEDRKKWEVQDINY